MGTSTDVLVTTVRNTRRSSTHYGPCDVCGKESSEVHVATRRRVYERSNGERYFGGHGAGTYGHLSCLESRGENLIPESSLRRERGALLAPHCLEDTRSTQA
jgi:hypothetical protein